MIEAIQQPAVREVDSGPHYGRFAIEPLEPGFGVTLGNSLRRVLLSSLPGAAVTSVSIDGVSHEFSAIPHVKEDVTEILLNLKGLNVVAHADGPIRMTLDVHGQRAVTAADIQTTSDVEIRNPDLHICTLDSARAGLRMDMMVERGKGYVTADRNKKEGQPIGVIPIDAIFTPVRRANFFVEKTRVGQDTDWDRLLVEVWTDGTLQPVEAVSKAAALFTDHLGLFVKFGENIAGTSRRAMPTGDVPTRLASVPIDELELSVRAVNCLKANDISTVGALVGLTLTELLALRNFGRKSLDEIRDQLLAKNMVTPAELETLFVDPDREQEG